MEAGVGVPADWAMALERDIDGQVARAPRQAVGGQEVSAKIGSQAWTLSPFLLHLPSEALCYCLAPELLPPVSQLPKRMLLVCLRASGLGATSDNMPSPL